MRRSLGTTVAFAIRSRGGRCAHIIIITQCEVAPIGSAEMGQVGMEGVVAKAGVAQFE